MAASDSSTHSGTGDQQLSGETAHLVCFRLGGEEYGVEIGQVQEINRMMPITRVPRAPSFMKGVINLRGQLIPIVDLRERFGMPAVEATKATRIVVVEIGHSRIGLIVDGVSEVLKLPVEHIDPAPDMMNDAQSGYVKGVGKSGDRLIVLLDLGPIILGTTEAGIATAS
jgi:purine-binding chemotaxis protein CheW